MSFEWKMERSGQDNNLDWQNREEVPQQKLDLYADCTERGRNIALSREAGKGYVVRTINGTTYLIPKSKNAE